MVASIYLDYAATTPVDQRVIERMVAHMSVDADFGNPASRSHAYGWQAEESVEAARVQVAEAINADPREIIWTSGATESDNLALKGAAFGSARRHIITSSIEHKAVLDCCGFLEQQGLEVTYLAPDAWGRTSVEQVREALREDTLMVSIMQVNNELGTVNELAPIGALCRSRGVLFHTDAAQSFGKLPIDVKALQVDLLSISAHKIYGPKGIGALYVRRANGLRLAPQMHGGGHEMGMRSGTLPAQQIVGLGTAAQLMIDNMDAERAHLSGLRERFLSHVRQIPDTVVHTHPEDHVPGIVNVGFAGVDGETLLLALPGLAVSSGSACTSASVEPSFVLRGIGVADELAHASLRFSFGRFTEPGDVDTAGHRLAATVGRLRGS
ncbi:MAG: aminotransferase class V-fold PLP-dependent enzyme [Pseudomonadota bacterium]|nr:aminotransferase class V-fold PLP-dependent enzyme [Pseudomonadota bacterium]